jgi:RNA polymerase-interacting CarD/CdnL/TRCF family regulator
MPFQIDDRVAHASHGVGRIVGLVTKRFFEAEARLYYEVAMSKSTVWAPVEAGPANGLRPLTPKAELPHYRGVLRNCPIPLTQDFRQRRLELLNRLRVGSFEAMCEVVRDLTARSWHKVLSESDADSLRKTREGVCQEWAAADGVSLGQATEEVEALLLESRRAYLA